MVALGLAALLGLLLLSRHYRLSIVVGDSMAPTYHTGDLLLVDRRAYQWDEPRRGDIVVARHDNDYIVKRIVGLPGEEIAVHRGLVEVNGTRLREDYATDPGQLEIGPGVLFAQRFALLGDNRAGGAALVHAVAARSELLGRVVGSLRWRLALIP